MTTLKSRTQQFILHSIVPIICSIGIGFIFYQGDVFNHYHPSFQFVWSAVFVSAFYNLLISIRPRDAYLGLIILSFFTFMTTQSTQPDFILRDILYIAGMGTTVILYVKYFRQSPHVNYLYTTVIFAGLYGILDILTSAIHLLIVRSFTFEITVDTLTSIVSSSAFFGILIGSAMGAGIALADRFFGTTEPAGRETAPNEQTNATPK